MSGSIGSSRLMKSAVFLPIACLSLASTVVVTGGGSTVAVAPSMDPEPRPDASVVQAAIEAPASVSSPEIAAASSFVGDAQAIASRTSTGEIDLRALAAYQRAESVINSADTTCNLTWQLIAAIGRVESNHGRFGGNTLDDDGVAQPGIYGVALDGSRNTATIRDSDAGQYDNDTRFDHAVGPMQFIPSTWSVVGVDADNDGQRNPQDIDDAALASAVYLCSGNDDLSTVAGQQGAVFRYNYSQSYVDLVLSVMGTYLQDDTVSMPGTALAAGYVVPARAISPADAGQRDRAGKSVETRKSDQGDFRDGRPSPSAGFEPAAPESPEPGTPAPTDPEPNQPTPPPATPADPDPQEPVEPVEPVDPQEPVEPVDPQEPVEPVEPVDPQEPVEEDPQGEEPEVQEPTYDPALTLEEAQEQCALVGLVDDPESTTDEFDVCVFAYTTPPEELDDQAAPEGS